MVNKKDSELAVLAGVDIAPDDKVRMLDVSAGTAGSKEGTVAGLAQGLGFGKLVAVGYNGLSTWIDPAATDWAAVLADGLGWAQVWYDTATGTATLRVGNGNGTQSVQFSSTATSTSLQFNGGGANVTIDASATALDLGVFPASGSTFEFFDNGAKATLSMTSADGSQTDPMIDLESGMLAVAPNGSVGGVTPTTTAFVIGWDGTKYVATSLAAVYEAFGTAILKAFVNAKGDLVSASADNTPSIVTVGADDTILMADSAQTSGLKWVASATPSTQAIGDAAAVGTADTFTRGDHKHAMPVAADIYALAQSLNAQTGTTYTLVAGDAGKLVTLSNAGAITLTVPQDSAATFAIGAWVEGYQLGAGQVTVAAGTGATLRSTPTAKSRAQYSRFFLQKISANTWALSGDVAAT